MSSRWTSCLNARYVVSNVLASFSYLTQDIALDQFSGRTKAPAIAINSPQPKKKAASKGRQEPVLQHVPHLPKPQLKFKRKVDNTNGVVWSSTLRHKFNARVPLGYSFDPASTREELNQDLCVLLTVSSLSILTISRPPHPYRYEINNLTYPDHMFQSQPPITFKPFEEAPLTLVSTSAQLVSLIDKLRVCKEIAIDLEYHSYRAYTGFVCLMQISTRDEDWIVDPFELRDELEDLNEVFTNPNIVKARSIFLKLESRLTYRRYCTAPIVTSFGFSKTSIYIS